MVHTPAINIVRQVIDQLEAGAHGVPVGPGQIFEIDIVDRERVAIAIDQVDDRATNASDRRKPQFHRPGARLDRLRASGDRHVIGLFRIAHAKRHPARRRPVLGGEISGGRARFVVRDHVDLALAPQVDILRTVPGDSREAQFLEYRLKQALVRRAEFDEFEAVQAKGVLE